MIEIYDGNNYYRRVLETDITGLAPRTILSRFLEPKNPIIWVWDGLHGNARRREIFPAYKRNRKPIKGEIYAGFDVLAEVLKFTPAIQVKVPGYEGDDVIASLVNHYAGAGEPVAIYSNDFDFAQLVGRYPNKVFAGFAPKAAVPLDLVRYFKICVGDSSDNIPGIRLFGDKTWENVDKGKLKFFLDTIIEDGLVGEIDLPAGVMTWIRANVRTIQNYAKIIDFFDVSLDLIADHMTLGKADYQSADTYLKGFFQ